MYFSDYNKEITYSTSWGGILEVCGKGKVCKEDTNVSPLSGSLKEWAGRFSRIVLTAGWLTRFSADILKNKDLEYYLRTANKRFK